MSTRHAQTRRRPLLLQRKPDVFAVELQHYPRTRYGIPVARSPRRLISFLVLVSCVSAVCDTAFTGQEFHRHRIRMWGSGGTTHLPPPTWRLGIRGGGSGHCCNSCGVRFYSLRTVAGRPRRPPPPTWRLGIRGSWPAAQTLEPRNIVEASEISERIPPPC